MLTLSTRRLAAAVAVAAAACAASADSLTIQLLPDTQSAPINGGTTYLAMVTNNTSDVLDLNALQINTGSPDLSGDAQPFFDNFPLTLDPVTNNPFTAKLFTIDVANTAQVAQYSGLVEILGAVDGSGNPDSTLGAASFTVNVVQAVPEPGVFVALGAGLIGLARRRTRKN